METRKFLQALLKLQSLQLEVKEGYALNMDISYYGTGRVLNAWFFQTNADYKMIATMTMWENEEMSEYNKCEVTEFIGAVRNTMFNQNN